MSQGDEPDLDEVLAEYLDRSSRGERPSRDEYLRRFPALRAELAKHFETLRAFDSLVQTDPAYPAHNQTIGGYRLGRILGRGSMGVVYLGEDVASGQNVAIKIMGSSLTQSEESLERFRREARIASKLRHPNLITVRAHGESQGYPYLVMDYVPGPTLAQVLQRLRDLKSDGIADPDLALVVAELCGSPTTSQPRVGRFDLAARIVALVADALEHAHAQGVIHRDVKPQNILLEPNLVPRLGDFGLAKDAAATSLSRSSQAIGTPCYMSPEMVRAEAARIDHRTDVYSLGATLYELLTLQAPFSGGSVQELFFKITAHEPPALARADREIPRGLQAIVMKALEKDPARRYATAATMAEDLRRHASGLPPHARMPSLGTRGMRAARRYQRPLLAVASCLLLGLAVFPRVTGWPAAAATADVTFTTEDVIGEASLSALPLGQPAPRLLAEHDRPGGPWSLTLKPGADYLVTVRSRDGRVAERQVRVAPTPGRQSFGLGRSTDARLVRADMVTIPAGTYSIGYTPPSGATFSRREQRVRVEAFAIDRCEVCNEQYQSFVRATGRLHPTWGDRCPAGSERLPVVGVKWDDAKAYAEWAGKRLPTDVEWEVAGRGPEARAYSWGNELSLTAPQANLGRPRATAGAIIAGTPCDVDAATADVSPFGVLHMVGNAREWVADPWYPREAEDPGASADARVRAFALGDRTVRGSCYLYSPARSTCRLSERKPEKGEQPAERGLGFRCALSTPDP